MANEPARNPPAPLTPDEELAWRALARAVLVIPKVLDGELLPAQGLGLTEYSVLMNLSEQPGRSMRMSELANAVMISAIGSQRPGGSGGYWRGSSVPRGGWTRPSRNGTWALVSARADLDPHSGHG